MPVGGGVSGGRLGVVVIVVGTGVLASEGSWMPVASLWPMRISAGTTARAPLRGQEALDVAAVYGDVG